MLLFKIRSLAASVLGACPTANANFLPFLINVLDRESCNCLYLEGIQLVIFTFFLLHKERNWLTWDRTHGFPFQAHTV